MSHLELFHIRISQYELYKEGDGLVDQLLHDMATEHIVHISKYCDGRPAAATALVLWKLRVPNSACTQICGLRDFPKGCPTKTLTHVQ